MTDKRFEQVIQEKISELPQQMQPERDLWQGIDIALTEQAQTEPTKKKQISTDGNSLLSIADWFLLKPMAMAASVMLVAFFSWQTFNSAELNSNPSNLVVQMMLQHEEQKSVLLASYAQSPELTSNWQAQLQELEEAANAIASALQSDPENIALLKMLQQVHQKQLQLIESVHAAPWQTI